MDFTSAPWIWLYVGAVLMLLEVVTPGFVVFFFGLSACTVAGCAFAVADLSVNWQLALFSVFAVVYLVGLRRLLRNVFSGQSDAAGPGLTGEYVGRVGQIVEPVRPSVPGRVLVGDAEWTAASDEEIRPGDAVRVVQQDNLTLKVEKI